MVIKPETVKSKILLLLDRFSDSRGINYGNLIAHYIMEELGLKLTPSKFKKLSEIPFLTIMRTRAKMKAEGIYPEAPDKKLPKSQIKIEEFFKRDKDVGISKKIEK